jgi:hypothetical protein
VIDQSNKPDHQRGINRVGQAAEGEHATSGCSLHLSRLRVAHEHHSPDAVSNEATAGDNPSTRLIKLIRRSHFPARRASPCWSIINWVIEIPDNADGQHPVGEVVKL